jgi:glycosyltransferase involved in cell wall biosynthesis
VQHVHAHFAWEAAAAAMVVSRLLGRPWSVTLHANDMYARRRHLREKLADADRVITVCDYNRRRLVELEGVNRPIPVVVCGVERTEDESTEKDIDVVAVGRLVEKKGFDLLISACALLRHRLPGLRVMIIGEGPLRASLQRMIDELELTGFVTLVGPRPHEEVLACIATSRLMALPCRVASDDDRDSMPIVVKEAMMRSVPVVGADVAAMGEMVDDSCGRLVPANDPAALADAIAELLADDALRGELGQAARRRALDRFDVDDEVTKLRQEFAELAFKRVRRS